MKKDLKIGVIGLGYVGLPLAIELGKTFPLVGFDINSKRVQQLNNGIDETLEVTSLDIESSKLLHITDDPDQLANCDVYIITVPTPIDEQSKPDLNPILSATTLISDYINEGDTIIYESTVYPGLTEEICAPLIEKNTSLEYNKDFFCGYSPERINPGDKNHTLRNITKIISGSTSETLDLLEAIYSKVVDVGLHKAKSIKVAEMAKVIENTQRDINIALINEITQICHRLDLDVTSVLEAAKTKWNFLDFKPGMVGGHCIGVDPYYLLYKANEVNYHPKIITAGRELNDEMSSYIADDALSLFKKNVKNLKVLIMGLTFKENCPDIRNTKVYDLASHISSKGHQVKCYDPWVSDKNIDSNDFLHVNSLTENEFNLIIIAVGHDLFIDMGINQIKKYLIPGEGKIYDVKSLFSEKDVDGRL